MKSLNEAKQIVNHARMLIVHDAGMKPYSILLHAEDHINDEADKILKPIFEKE